MASSATADKNPYVLKVREYVKTHLACEAVVISAQIESDLIDLSADEAKEFLITVSGIRKSYPVAIEMASCLRQFL